MRSFNSYAACAFVAGLLCVNGYAQSSRWYFGSGIGAQQWRGNLNAHVGMGGELTLGRYLSRHGTLSFTAGFASLPFQQSNLSNGVKFILLTRESNLFHGDFIVDLHPFGMNTVSPFVRFGGGLLNVQVGSAARKNYAAGVLGAGLRVKLTRDLALNLTGNYHHLAGQALEGFASGKNPEGYFGARVGLTFSTRAGNAESEEPWFTTLEAEPAPPETSPEPEKKPAFVETAPLDSTEEQDEEFSVTEDLWNDEIDEAAVSSEAENEELNDAAVSREEEKVEPSTEESPRPEASALSENQPSALEETTVAGDPFSTFNRKIDLLEKESEAEAPVTVAPKVSPLGDEPKFEEFYPHAKPEPVASFKDKLFTDERAAEPEEAAEEGVEVAPTPQMSAFEERLAKLDEQEDFLSPATELAETPQQMTREVQNEEAARAEATAELLFPSPQKSTPDAPASAEEASPLLEEKTFSQEQSAHPTPSESMPQSQTVAREPARAEALPAWKEPAAQTQPSQPQTQRRARTSAQAHTAARPPAAETPKTSGRNEHEEQELIELRVRLEELESGGSSHSDHNVNVARALALTSDPEVAELHVRLDEITGELDEKNMPEAYEAFKDRLGLLEEEPKNAAPIDWDQQQLKSQIQDLDQELAKKEEDISAIRTALAQSAANGAAFPTRTVVTRGSFAQGYESALSSFYMQQYAEAIGKFSRLLEEYPSHTLTSNCYYWLGEAQYGHGDYPAALASFNRVLTFQKSLKKDNALLMLGKTYQAMQRLTDARAVINRLMSEFPASDAVAKAQELLKSM